jgi:hypothetical protein
MLSINCKAKFCYTQCHISLIAMLKVIVLSVEAPSPLITVLKSFIVHAPGESRMKKKVL